MFSTAVHCVFFSNCNALNHGLSYRGYYYSQCMKEIKGKSILVRVSARFELATVRVIGSRLYFYSGIRSIERTLKRIPRATRGGGGGRPYEYDGDVLCLAYR